VSFYHVPVQSEEKNKSQEQGGRGDQEIFLLFTFHFSNREVGEIGEGFILLAFHFLMR